MQHPFKSLLTLGSVFGLMALMAFVYPTDGIKISDQLSLNFPPLSRFLDKKEAKTDISKILQLADQISLNDSLGIAADSLQTKDTSAVKKIKNTRA